MATESSSVKQTAHNPQLLQRGCDVTQWHNPLGIVSRDFHLPRSRVGHLNAVAPTMGV
jgi:hypothetical protein